MPLCRAHRYTPLKYDHWASSATWQEPNNAFGNEYCAVSNYTEAYSGAWGWADAACAGNYPYICRVDVPNVYYYYSNRTGTSYMLNTTNGTQAEAEQVCLAMGGHLAYFTSLGEQQEVEAAFVYDGGLIPRYHQAYWLGLSSNATLWPTFSWLERTTPPLAGRAYQHWGVAEPNNAMEAEFCGVANYSMAYGAAFGWQDSICERVLPYVCKVNKAGTWSYRSDTSGTTYVLNTTLSSIKDARASCRQKGGVVASYESLFEQQEVEAYFIDVVGTLIPQFHRHYWLGLGAVKWPEFRWFDNTSGPSTPQAPGDDYGHWGSMVSEMGDVLDEPNGGMLGGPPEQCAVANYTQAYSSAWGWSDVACTAANYSTICKIYRECRVQLQR